MNPGSTIVRDYFSDEYTNISYTIDVWKNTGASQQLNLRQSAPVYHVAAESTNVVAQVSPIVENTHASAGADSCTGKTIQQCVTDAMAQLQQAQKALQQAQQQFATSVPPLQAAVSKNTASIGKNSDDISDNNASVMTMVKDNKDTIAKNAQAISNNTEAIRSNTATLQSNLSWCDCSTHKLNSHLFSSFPAFVNNCGGEWALVDFTCPDGYMIVQLQAGIATSSHGMETCWKEPNGDGGVVVQCCRPCYK